LRNGSQAREIVAYEFYLFDLGTVVGRSKFDQSIEFFIDDTAVVETDLLLVAFEAFLYLLLDEMHPDSLIVNFDMLLAIGRLYLKNYVLLMEICYLLIATDIEDIIQMFVLDSVNLGHILQLYLSKGFYPNLLALNINANAIFWNNRRLAFDLGALMNDILIFVGSIEEGLAI
jgi:hypothetical protein